MKTSELIRAQLAALDKSQYWLAKQMHVQPSQVGLWFHGHSRPSAASRAKLMLILGGRPEDWIFAE